MSRAVDMSAPASFGPAPRARAMAKGDGASSAAVQVMTMALITARRIRTTETTRRTWSRRPVWGFGRP